MRVLARDNHAVDDGWLCDKGRFGYQMFSSPDRITEPMARQGDGSLSPISWDEAVERIGSRLRSSGERAAALVGGSTSNEEGWLTQKLIRESGSRAVASSSNPVDPGLLAELSRPELASKVRDLDYAGAILVIGTDPLHEMPILDLRIRKAIRRGDAKLAVASERPTALDGGAAVDAVRYAPGESAAFVRALATALGGEKPKGPHARGATAIAEHLLSVPDPVIVWGERLWRDEGAVAALADAARALKMHQSLGPGLLEVPEESNARGLREAGCIPGAGPGLAPAGDGLGSDAIKEGLRTGELDTLLLVNSNPVRNHPDGPGWADALRRSFVVSIAMFDDESTKHADLVLPAETHAEKEGVVTHPEGRLQRLRPNVPHPDDVRPGWQVLGSIATAAGIDVDADTAEEVFEALCREVPFYGPTSYEEIGGKGLRWQDRDPGSSWTPPERVPEPAAPTPAPGGDDEGLVLGTYRDLWATDITERNPAIRFLAPTQKLELSAADAKDLELGNGDPVTVSVNGNSVDARVSIKQRIPKGVAFVIEGTKESNGNALANGAPVRVKVSKREEPASTNGSRAKVVETPMPAGGPPS
jgi:NADH-quinone oxidoreductase subunit G